MKYSMVVIKEEPPGVLELAVAIEVLQISYVIIMAIILIARK